MQPLKTTGLDYSFSKFDLKQNITKVFYLKVRFQPNFKQVLWIEKVYCANEIFEKKTIVFLSFKVGVIKKSLANPS